MPSLPDLPQKPRGKEKSKALRQSVNSHIEQLANAVDSVRASEEFTAYLGAPGPGQWFPPGRPGT